MFLNSNSNGDDGLSTVTNTSISSMDDESSKKELVIANSDGTALSTEYSSGQATPNRIDE